jgi:hypothetical protein
MKLARFRKLKTACFLSYVEYRPNTNISKGVVTYKREGKRRKLRR